MSETTATPAAPTTADTAAPAAEVTAAAAQGVEQGTATPAPAPAAPKVDANGLPTDPTELQNMIRDLRRENGAARTTAKQQAAEQARQELAQQIGKAIGLVADDQPVDPEKLTQDLTTARDAQRQAVVELAVYKAAGTAGADPDALLDSRSFAAKISALDPTADDFTTQIAEAITSAVADNPKFKTAALAAGRSGTEMSGGTGEQSVTPEQFAAMNYEQRTALYQSNPGLYRKLTGTA
jgi:hypothetical protein